MSDPRFPPLPQQLTHSDGLPSGLVTKALSDGADLVYARKDELLALRKVAAAAALLVSTPGGEDRLRRHRAMALAEELGKLDATRLPGGDT
jgi:hypothetical protein